jgi:HEAT repeat protein
MKRFISAASLCVFLLVGGLFVFLPSSEAQNNVLANLLDLPAPPPPNPLVNNLPKRAYSRTKPPQDDAPVDELMSYWQEMNQYNPKYNYSPEPTDKSLERLLSELEKKPEELLNFLNVLTRKPEAADFVKRLYDREVSERNMEEGWRDTVRQWLIYNSSYFSDDLFEVAKEATETSEYLTNQAEVLALARVDWNKARPLIDGWYNNSSQPFMQTLARWAYYQHALSEGSTSDVDRYRKELQATVEDKNAKPGNRDLAMDALVESGDFPGRDDWYYTLLEDETLFDLRVNGSAYTSLTTLLNHSPSDKYTEKMLELIKSDNQAVRNAAARNLSTLLDERNPEVVRALIPWLENPKWAREVNNERSTLVAALAYLQMPESVPGLISMLNEADKKEVTYTTSGNMSSNSNARVYTSNTMVYTSNSVSVISPNSVQKSYPYRSGAITALAAQKDSRAAQPLRALLPEIDEYQRANVVLAILVSNGFSIYEQVEALESVVKNSIPTNPVQSSNTNALKTTSTVLDEVPTEKEVLQMRVANTFSITTNTGVYTRSYDPNDIKGILGNQIINNAEPSDEFVRALVERIDTLRTKDAALAQNLRKVIMNWRGAAVNSLFLRDLKNGRADSDAIVKLLSVRKDLREKQSTEVYELRTGASQTVFGISACILEDANEYGAILSGENIESKIALLGCARLIRAPLSVQTVAANLQSPNKLLARAAELYLESEDSPEARAIVLSMHPNEAKILGARTYFYTEDSSGISSYTPELFASVSDSYAFTNYYFLDSSFEELAAVEKNLKKEVAENQDLLGVYAYNGNYIRIYKDKAVFSRTENAARYRERDLTKEEFDNFKYYLASQRVDELAPFLSPCDECLERELLMLGRGGGRRVFVKADRMPPFFAQLDEMFEEMSKSPSKLRYALEKNVAGLEILFSDDQLKTLSVWKTGDDFRVLIEDAERRKRIDKELDLQDEIDRNKEDVDYEEFEKMSRKRREQRQYENFSWFKFERGKLGDFSTQPPQIEYLPARDSFPVSAPEKGQWKSRATGIEIRADSDGLYKINRGAFSKLRSGYYDKPVLTPNGRWAIVTKYDEEGNVTPLRFNLLTNKEFKIVMPQFPMVEAVAFVPSLNKVLLFGGAFYEEEYEESLPRNGTYFLLDAETGIVQKVKGEVQPLIQQTVRPLQAATMPDEFWAAIPDAEKNETQVGVYNAKTLTFKPLLKIPQIRFDSMNMWVDAGKIYFVYEGHLLSLPIPKA